VHLAIVLDTDHAVPDQVEIAGDRHLKGLGKGVYDARLGTDPQPPQRLRAVPAADQQGAPDPGGLGEPGRRGADPVPLRICTMRTPRLWPSVTR
jgi:hypothetical protein